MTDKEKISELKNLVEILCDNISDQPAGCDACWLWENNVCAKEDLYEKMKVESEDKEMKFTTRKEQRIVNEVVSAILLPLIPHLKEDEANAVQTAIRILQGVEVESKENGSECE